MSLASGAVRLRSAGLLLIVATAVLAVLPAPPASAAPGLRVTPLTWNVLGLDGNDVTSGPNRYPVGARVCNVGTVTATGVVVRLTFSTASPYLTLLGPASIAKGSLGAGACADAYFEVAVARSTASYGARRGYRITATATGVAMAGTPVPRELFVKKLISQNRNQVVSITGPSLVYVGRTYTFRLVSSTAPGGYEQLESHLGIPTSFLELRRIRTVYGTPAGATNDAAYADGCGWNPVPTSPSYLTCIGPAGYPGGKVGGSIDTTYTVRVLRTGTAKLSGLIYDKSGTSYHYNADYGVAPNLLTVTAVNPPDVSIRKTHVGSSWPVGTTATWTLTVRNDGGVATTGKTTVSDTLPTGTTAVSAAGSGWSCTIAGQKVSCSTIRALPPGGTSTITLRVRVTAAAPATLVNTARVTTPDDSDPADNVSTDRVAVTRTAPRPSTMPSAGSASAAPRPGGSASAGTGQGADTASPPGGRVISASGPTTLPFTGFPLGDAVAFACWCLFAGAAALALSQVWRVRIALAGLSRRD